MEKISNKKILVSICARKGSKGYPGKNVTSFMGKPLIVHTIEQALAWPHKTRVIVSTDCDQIADIARKAGAEVPFLRPDHLANDTIGKLPVLQHAFTKSEEYFNEKFDILFDMDPTAPLRRQVDMDTGLRTFIDTKAELCFSVTRARKNPYFNMVERDTEGRIGLSKRPAANVYSRQASPDVWDMNASIYVYDRAFLLSKAAILWEARCEIFEMPPESAFDIDLERDFIITEALMKHYYGGRSVI